MHISINNDIRRFDEILVQLIDLLLEIKELGDVAWERTPRHELMINLIRSLFFMPNSKASYPDPYALDFNKFIAFSAIKQVITNSYHE